MKPVTAFFRCPGTWISPWVILMIALPLDAQQGQPSLDELLNIKPPAEETAPEAAPPMQAPTSAAAPNFAGVVQDMLAVSERLGRHFDPGIETQRAQESILARLDQMIKAAERSASSSSSSSSRSSSQQSREQDSGSQQAMPGQAQQHQSANASSSSGDSSPNIINPGAAAGEGGGLEPFRQNRVEWGNLPPRLREELLQVTGDRFSPVYREMTEAYYQRLAEESRP